MISLLIGTVVTIFMLVKMFFSDMAGGTTIKESVVEGIRDAKRMHNEIEEAMNTDYDEELDKEEGLFNKAKSKVKINV